MEEENVMIIRKLTPADYHGMLVLYREQDSTRGGRRSAERMSYTAVTKQGGEAPEKKN
jgi:hypothetical protein